MEAITREHKGPNGHSNGSGNGPVPGGSAGTGDRLPDVWPSDSIAAVLSRTAVVDGVIPGYDPATLRRIGTAPALDANAVRASVAAARAAAPAWAATSFAERRRVLRALLDRILAEKDAICTEAARDSGKSLVDAAMGELFPVCEKIRYVLAHGAKDLAPAR